MFKQRLFVCWSAIWVYKTNFILRNVLNSVNNLYFRTECFCGNSFGSYGNSTICDITYQSTASFDTCNGDVNEICGGFNANSVYSTQYYQSKNQWLELP